MPALPAFKTAPKAGIYTVSLSAGGWIDLVQDGHSLKPKAFSGATDCDGIRKTMKYELRQPVRAADQRRQGKFGLDRDPAVRIDQYRVHFYPDFRSLLLFPPSDIPIGRKPPGSTERRFRLSHPTSTNA